MLTRSHRFVVPVQARRFSTAAAATASSAAVSTTTSVQTAPGDTNGMQMSFPGQANPLVDASQDLQDLPF